MMAKQLPYKVFLLSLPLMCFFSLQSMVFCETETDALGKKSRKSKDIVILGAFATTEKPEEHPCPDKGVPLKLTYGIDDEYYLGIIVQNNTDVSHEATVSFRFSGDIKDREKEEKTIVRGTNYLTTRYIFPREGNYTCKMIFNIKDSQIKRKAKILLKVNDEGGDVCNNRN
jgi:hypothetical protein